MTWPRHRRLLPIMAVLMAGPAADPMAQRSGARGGAGAVNATIEVTPGAVDDIINRNCSLVEAIIAANTDQPRDSWTAGSGADTLHAPGRFVLSTVPAATKSRSGLRAVTSAISILNARISRDVATPAFRILHVDGRDGGDLTLVNVSSATRRRPAPPEPSPSAAGSPDFGTASLTTSRLLGNTAVAPDGTAMGGGIYQENGSTSLIGTRVRGKLPDQCQPTIPGCE